MNFFHANLYPISISTFHLQAFSSMAEAAFENATSSSDDEPATYILSGRFKFIVEKLIATAERLAMRLPAVAFQLSEPNALLVFASHMLISRGAVSLFLYPYSCLQVTQFSPRTTPCSLKRFTEEVHPGLVRVLESYGT